MNIKKIAGAALNQTPIDFKGNFENIIEAIQQAKNEKVCLLLLPELCITGYGCEDLFLSDWVYEKSMQVLLDILPYTSDIIVSVGLPVKIDNVNYNTSCVIFNQKIQGFTVKQFLANDGVHYEPRWFRPWRAGEQKTICVNNDHYPFGDVTYDLSGITFGFEICEDAWHVDRPGQRLAAQGIKLILNPSASHFSFYKTKKRENDVVLAATHNYNCAYLYANLLGNEAGRIVYDGEIIIAAKGELYAKNKRLSFKNVNLVTHEIDIETLDSVSEKVNPDFYEKHEEFVAASALCLFDYLRKSKSKGFVLSLSGGADSSCCAVLVAEMVKRGVEELGVQAFIEKAQLQSLFSDIEKKYTIKELINSILTTVYQWAANSGWDTFDSAKGLAEDIGASFYSWRIDKEVASYTSTLEVCLQRKLTWEQDDITLQNIQARSRAPIVWMLTNVKNALLITTSNRSEGDVGYATMDGDTCGSIAPIAGVEKAFVQQWLIWAQSTLGYEGLRYVNALIPTAELRPPDRSQTDEKDLMPYPILALIEKEAIRNWKSPKEVYDALKSEVLVDSEDLKKYIQKFFLMWSRNQWKRERIAPSFLLDDFNVDPRTWCRFPILSGSFDFSEMSKW